VGHLFCFFFFFLFFGRGGGGRQVLCSAWNDDGTAVFSAGCDNQAKMWAIFFVSFLFFLLFLGGGGGQVLCSAWNNDGTAVFSAGCDNQAKMWALTQPGAPVSHSRGPRCAHPRDRLGSQDEVPPHGELGQDPEVCLHSLDLLRLPAFPCSPAGVPAPLPWPTAGVPAPSP